MRHLITKFLTAWHILNGQIQVFHLFFEIPVLEINFKISEIVVLSKLPSLPVSPNATYRPKSRVSFEWPLTDFIKQNFFALLWTFKIFFAYIFNLNFLYFSAENLQLYIRRNQKVLFDERAYKIRWWTDSNAKNDV